MNKTDISIIIPAYNEEFRIEKTLDEVQSYMLAQNYNFEVIVVDDKSQDKTVNILRTFSLNHSNFKFLENPENKGKGYSVKRGILEATGELRLFMDADSSVKIDYISEFIKKVEEGFDIVIASIELPGSTHRDDNHYYRRILGKWAKGLIRTTVTPNIRDTQRGFKLFTRKAVEMTFPFQNIDRWGFDIEIIAIALSKGLKIKELPVNWFNSSSKSVKILNYLVTLIELAKIKTNLIFGRYR